MSQIRSNLSAALFLSAAAVLVALGSTGCADEKAALKAPQVPTTTAIGAHAPADANARANAGNGNGSGAGVETPGLHVSDAIARACNLPRLEIAPSFEFDSAAIGDADRALLGAIARCLGEGPLKGRDLALTGRADARGEEEYNMGLGESRADSVRRYLHDLGVQQERLRATSRGEIDATGGDEAGWAHDRRVDIDLAN